MTSKFPELRDSQVALLRAEISTGIVLDEHFNRATSPSQNVYTIFEDFNSAIDFAKSLINKRKDIECNLYGKEMNFIQRISY